MVRPVATGRDHGAAGRLPAHVAPERHRPGSRRDACPLMMRGDTTVRNRGAPDACRLMVRRGPAYGNAAQPDAYRFTVRRYGAVRRHGAAGRPWAHGAPV